MRKKYFGLKNIQPSAAGIVYIMKVCRFKMIALGIISITVAAGLIFYGTLLRQDSVMEGVEDNIEEPLRIALITDIDHCPSRQSVSMKNLDLFLFQANQKPVDFIVSLGDIASHRLRDCSKTGDMDARFITEKLRSAGKPVHLILGDHDIESSVKSYHTWLETAQKNETYYSFDTKNVHVIVLDTVLGGEPLSLPCEEREDCKNLIDRQSYLINNAYSRYQLQYPDAQKNRAKEYTALKAALELKRQEIGMTRSWDHRGKGWVSEGQLLWLKRDLENSRLERVVLMSSHPIFPLTSDEQTRDIINGDKLRVILEESNKKVVAISGEAHLWREEEINNVRYYIVDEFRKANGSWAYFTWGENKFLFEKILH